MLERAEFEERPQQADMKGTIWDSDIMIRVSLRDSSSSWGWLYKSMESQLLKASTMSVEPIFGAKQESHNHLKQRGDQT